MKFTTKEDIEAPLAFVYSAISDFNYWERAAMRRGADVNRTDRLHKAGAGMGWKIDFQYRGKLRNLEVNLLEMIDEQRLAFSMLGKPANGTLSIDMAEMGPKRTRIRIAAEVKPNTLAARVFIQSLRLAKAKVNRKFELRFAQVAADIEDRYRAQIIT
ncbi:MAG: carbon monoxide dehydrogenase subunit G [Pseudorhodobacter sp.]|jgi:carbon monoxide dehydrogenase subunit G